MLKPEITTRHITTLYTNAEWQAQYSLCTYNFCTYATPADPPVCLYRSSTKLAPCSENLPKYDSLAIVRMLHDRRLIHDVWPTVKMTLYMPVSVKRVLQYVQVGRIRVNILFQLYAQSVAHAPAAPPSLYPHQGSMRHVGSTALPCAPGSKKGMQSVVVSLKPQR
jgi:hypothetical protein